MIAPADCQNMHDIRREIDNIDQNIIALIGTRYQYVLAAAKFKTSETAVKAPDRFTSMLLQRREWAEAQNLDPDMIEKLYTDMVNHFISQELKHWKGAITYCLNFRRCTK